MTLPKPHCVRPPHHELPRGNRYDAAGHDGTSLNRSPRPSTAPAGLFAPAPEVVREKVAKPQRTISQAGNLARQRPCGSETAAKRHKRNGEVDANGQITCAECVAGREQRRLPRPVAAKRVKPPAKPQVRLQVPSDRQQPTVGPKCGEKAGRSWHRRRNEWPCEPCKSAVNEAARGVHRNRGGQEKAA